MVHSNSVVILAGEPSGDRLGAALMQALRTERSDLVIAGAGGPAMQAVGLESLFPITDIAVMGLVEVVPKLPRIRRRIRQTVDFIVTTQPAVVITIDSPDFMHRVVRRARARCPNTKFVNYVAPTVWNWRAGRAKRIAELYDLQLVLLPFEPPYFEAVGLACQFVGHPVLECSASNLPTRAEARAELGISESATVVVALPGSRGGEVRRHSQVFGAALRQFATSAPEVAVLVPAAHGVEEQVNQAVGEWTVATSVLRAPGDEARERQKWTAFAAADVALATSGTVMLELALAQVPTVLAYRVSPVTWAIGYYMVKSRTASLVNILLGEPAIPEFLQSRCRPDLLAAALTDLAHDQPHRETQLMAMRRALKLLDPGGGSPSSRAAKAVLSLLQPMPVAS